MSNITAPRDAKLRLGETFDDGVKADEVIHLGAAVLLQSGYLVNAADGVSGTARGVAQQSADATGKSSGAVVCRVRPGMFEFHIEGSDPVVQSDVTGGSIVYFKDNQTISKGSNSNARPVAGILRLITSSGKAVVEVGHTSLLAANGDLVAANNLSDVGSAATSRANIGANKMSLKLGTVSTKASDSGKLYGALPVAGTVIGVITVLNGALASADATGQLKLAGSNCGATTSGLVTMTQASSAAGDVAHASPITTNIAGAQYAKLEFDIGGGSTATATADVYVVISY